MKYLLDTDTTSQPNKPGPDAAYLQWLSLQAPSTLAMSVVSVLELNFGVTLLPAGKRQTASHTWVDESLPMMFEGRILPVTLEIATDAGKLLARKSLKATTSRWLMRSLPLLPGCMASRS